MPTSILATLDYAEPNLADAGVTVRSIAGVTLLARTAAPVLAGTGGTRYQVTLEIPDPAPGTVVLDWDFEAGAVRYREQVVLGGFTDAHAEQLDFVHAALVAAVPNGGGVSLFPAPPVPEGRIGLVYNVLRGTNPVKDVEATVSIVGKGGILWKGVAISQREFFAATGANGQGVVVLFPSSTLSDTKGNTNLPYRIVLETEGIDITTPLEGHTDLAMLLKQLADARAAQAAQSDT